MRLVVTLGAVDVEITEPTAGGAYPWLVKVGTLLLSARAGHLDGVGAGAAAGCTVQLDNTARQAAALLGFCPRAPATLYGDAGDLFFSGLVQQMAFGALLTLTLEAGGGKRLDSESLPLRSTRMLGDYAEDLDLPEVYGDLTAAPFPLIRLSDTRFFAADHPMRITKAFTAKQLASGWARVLASDDTGRTWTEVHFAAPVPPDVEVSACGTGREDDDTGEVISNPADIARYAYILAGRTDDLSALRAECAGLALTGAGRFASRQAIMLQVDQVLQSFGAISIPGAARLYPSGATPAPVLDLYPGEVDDLLVTASLTDTADVLRLSYDRSDASGRAQHYIELTASPQRYGGLAKEVSYDWLRKPKDAETVGVPVLQRLSGERYDVTFSSTNAALRPLMLVRLVGHADWPLPGADPVVMILECEVDPDNNSVRVTRAETIIGQSVITVTAHSIALPDTVEAGVDVAVRDGIATFTFHDDDGKPIAGAHVSLDGAAPRTTDAQGKVRFPVSGSGVHELAFEKSGFVPFTVQVPL